MKRLVSRLRSTFQASRQLILELLDYYFPRPVVTDEQGRRVIYARSGAIYYVGDPNRPKGKWYVVVSDEDIDKDEVRFTTAFNPVTGEEVDYFPYAIMRVPVENRMPLSQYNAWCKANQAHNREDNLPNADNSSQTVSA